MCFCGASMVQIVFALRPNEGKNAKTTSQKIHKCRMYFFVVLPVYPRLWTLGEFSEGQLSQVQVLLWIKNSTLQQLLPATTFSHALQQICTAQYSL